MTPQGSFVSTLSQTQTKLYLFSWEQFIHKTINTVRQFQTFLGNKKNRFYNKGPKFNILFIDLFSSKAKINISSVMIRLSILFRNVKWNSNHSEHRVFNNVYRKLFSIKKLKWNSNQFPVDERGRRFRRLVERLKRPKLERSRKCKGNQYHLGWKSSWNILLKSFQTNAEFRLKNSINIS